MDYAIKIDLIDKYSSEIEEMCELVKNGYFNQKNSHVYFYNKKTKTNTLLYEGLATNITYDNEIPTIMFDINTGEEINTSDKRKIMLSDIIAANTNIDGCMKILLSQGKQKLSFYMDTKLGSDENYSVTSDSVE